MDRSRLIPLVEKIEGRRILVVGDAMLDRFVSGEVDRISPEAPIPVLRVTAESSMPGGAGNVVRNLAALGAGVTFIAVCGDDAPGRELTAALSADPLVTADLKTDPARPTTIKIRYIAGNQQMMRADWEAGADIDDATATAMLDAAVRHIADFGAVVLSDYDKGVLAEGRASKIIDAARKAGVPVIVDPKGNGYDRYRGANLITPNRKELEQAAGKPATDSDAIRDAAHGLIKAHELGGMLVTRSADGMTLVSEDGDAHHLAAESREVFDVSGAGDTVVAAVAAMIASGADIRDAACVANTAAGIVVGKVGTAACHAAELIAALHHKDLSDAEAKVLTDAEALERIARWRRQGLKVGFTNGCFDLLHPGHVSLLAQARAACDRLVVGLNSDASVKRLKGEDRPVQNEAARSTVLASLASVDLVVIFGEDTPFELIERLHPDVLVKGADYTVEQVVGADLVSGWGGTIVLADLKDGFSTTATIERLNKNRS
ncbi:MAG: D-glycero-beta-D-manno-heptose-7-phosphate kinase [Rhodospirillales bacterium]|nr:D-glycero-beta-D-manno-heptose-7-phosphate kinase [Rhodospirillales bacterium]MBO6788454.1 D-glycero-beta-D-manno-heptose-7-phosphate kinase [Rhodospirillales bacterium]